MLRTSNYLPIVTAIAIGIFCGALASKALASRGGEHGNDGTDMKLGRKGIDMKWNKSKESKESKTSKESEALDVSKAEELFLDRSALRGALSQTQMQTKAKVRPPQLIIETSQSKEPPLSVTTKANVRLPRHSIENSSSKEILANKPQHVAVVPPTDGEIAHSTVLLFQRYQSLILTYETSGRVARQDKPGLCVYVSFEKVRHSLGLKALGSVYFPCSRSSDTSCDSARTPPTHLKRDRSSRSIPKRHAKLS